MIKQSTACIKQETEIGKGTNHRYVTVRATRNRKQSVINALPKTYSKTSIKPRKPKIPHPWARERAAQID